MTRTEEILIRLGISNAEVTRGLGLIKNQFNEFARSIKGELAGVFAGYFTKEGLESIIEYGKEISETAKRLGMSTEAVQVWGYALRKTGQDQEAIISFFEKMATARDKAMQGESGMVNAFRQFGITIDDLRSKRLEDLAEQISEVFKAGDPQKLIGSLREIGGRAAGGTVDALKDGIKEAKKEAKDLGLVMSSDVINELKEAGDRITEIGIRLKTFFAEPLVWAMKMIQSIILVVEEDVKRVVLSIHQMTTEAKHWFDSADVRNADKAFYEKERKGIDEEERRKFADIWRKRKPVQENFKGGANEQIENDQMRRENEEADRKELEARNKLKSLNEQLAELRKQDMQDFQAMANAELDSIERAKARNKLAQDHLDIANKQKEIQEATKDLDRQKEALSFAQKRREEEGSIFPTIAHLAKSGYFQRAGISGPWRWRQGPFAAIAQEIQQLSEDELGARTFGNLDRATWDKNHRLQLTSQLEKAGIISPERRLESIDEEIKRLNKTIADGTGKIGVPMNK